jgi:hypothetical protein
MRNVRLLPDVGFFEIFIFTLKICENQIEFDKCLVYLTLLVIQTKAKVLPGLKALVLARFAAGNAAEVRQRNRSAYHLLPGNAMTSIE